MPEEHHQDTEKLIKRIIASGKKNGKKSTNLSTVFTNLFLRDAPVDYLKSKTPESFYLCAEDTHKYISKRASNKETKIRVFNPKWEKERTILQMLTKDIPFLIDSTTAEINRHGLRIYEVLHPTIKTSRDKEGNLTSLLDADNEESGGLESIIQFEITYIADENIRQKLEQDVATVLEAVELSVLDWKKMLKKLEEIADYLNTSLLPYTTDHLDEVMDFCKWARDNHITLLGYGKYIATSKKDTFELSKDPKDKLGLFKFNPDDQSKTLDETKEKVAITNSKNPALIDFSKSEKPSLVHRSVHMDYIRIKDIDKNGKIIGEHRIFGLFTSSVYYQSATLIPIIRKKIDYVLNRAGFKHSSHNGKELVTILETYPRDELFQVNNELLFDNCIEILELNKRPRVRMFVRKDSFCKFISCIIFIPRERFNTQLREKIQLILEEEFGGRADDYYTQVTDSPLARLYVIVKTNTSKVTKVTIAQAERRLLEITNSWSDGLREILVDKMGEKHGDSMFHGYCDSFPTSYTNRYHFGGTYCDIIKMEDALNKDTLTLDLYKKNSDNDDIYQVKIFCPETQVTLSNILPILENMGFHVIDELTFKIQPYDKKNVWVHHFNLKVNVDLRALNVKSEQDYIASIKNEFETAFFKIWHREIEDDILNTLIVKGGMDWRDVTLLRAYAKYMKQAEFHYSFVYTTEGLSQHPILSKLLIDLFYAKFSPKLSAKKRESETAGILAQIDKSLTTVTNVSEDRIIRQFVDLIKATLRTNYFQKDENNNDKTYTSLKLDSSMVPDLPKPHPFREIFVYSYDIEGIHLRGGKVARGGLRWSDRIEDFRTEVLGLVKAQMVKNAVIVPVGSKGGFVVKQPIKSGSRDEMISQGIGCYKIFLKGLLDITDNIVKNKLTPPTNVVRHDGDDPYLVVAADKGTATFSDIANGLSEDYGFWLGDAFASGGSQGYDHKKMGITAKGAWVAVQRHFMEMGLDTQKEEFTVIGVGGMSGDVFGNGMLLSRHIKLVAAFGHSNIFIDPDPDPAASYKERLRMFKLERSTWSDYDKKLVSKGGGVFDRKAKSIPISKEMKARFNIEENSLSPDELVKKLLLADIDLFWNGGIGTYVKAESETQDEVGDRANDTVRINGKEMGAKVIGEGGNLGLTQLGRIEYSKHNGRANTDFIDNSAGVDCSDHEVNIKIALGKAIESGKITLADRNKILEQMTDEVEDLVLRDNKLQTQAITISELQGHTIIESQMRLMTALENHGLLDRKIEFLPENDEMIQRHSLEQGLTRPEISTIICYSKMSLYNDLIESNLPDDPYFSSDLSLYFPQPMRKRFADEIENHQLRREIVATTVCNSIVNRVGSEFFFHIQEDTGVKGCDVARGYTITRDAFNLRSLWGEIEALDGKIAVTAQVEMFTDIKNFIERTTLWFLRNLPHPLKVSDTVDEYEPRISELSRHLDNIMSPVLKEMVESQYNHYIEQGVNKELARKIANLIALAPACDIVRVARGSKLSVKVVGEIYFAVGMRMSLGWLRHCAESQPVSSYWDNLSQQTLVNSFYDQQRRLTAEVTKGACKDDICSGALDSWEKENEKDLERYDRFIEDLHNQERVDNSMLVVSIKRVDAISAD